MRNYILALAVALYMCSAVSSSALNFGKWFKHSSIKPLAAGSEYLDQENKYHLSWNVSDKDSKIYFEVVAETLGFVGFGFSPSGSMDGADLLIAGVDGEGNLYFKDYHGVGNTMPVEDEHQDWVVTDGDESNTHTTLKFERLLNTCDDEDFKITDDTLRVIWSIGETDDVAYHQDQRGTKSINFFLEDGDNDFDPANFYKVDITVNYEMPAEHTTYWCTIHEMPLFTQKQHIVGFEAILDNALAFQHTHHYIFHRCIAPEGQDPEEFFKPWLSHDGDYCYEQMVPDFPFAQYCSGNMIYVWTKGGKRMVFPPDIGLPMPDTLGKKEYFALEVHYDNPQNLAGQKFSTGGRIFYTSDLRDIEAGLLPIEHYTGAQLTIPPKASNYVVSGHCGSDCTEAFLPETGITIFNNLLHAHLTGRKLKLRHFRAGEELEWVDSDDYYDFNYQQNKQLRTPKKIQRGDHLTTECTFDTTKVAGGKAVIGGLSSQEEMCQAWVFFWPRLDNFTACGSEQDMDKHFGLFGVTNYTLKGSDYPGGNAQYVIFEPENLAGDYLDSISTKVDWNDEFRAKFQEEKRYGEHLQRCGSLKYVHEGVVQYPEFRTAYEPPNDCKADSSSEIIQVFSLFKILGFVIIVNRIWT